MRLALSCALSVFTLACAETRASDSRTDRPADEASARVETLAAPVDDTPAAGSDAPAFDFRRVRTEPAEHYGQARVCDVAFADDAHALEPREQALYPERVAHRRTVRCAAPSGGGWLEVIFGSAEGVDDVVPGRRVLLAPERPVGGRHGYVLARYLSTVGEAPTAGADDGAERRSEGPAFDFERVRSEGGLVGTRQPCLVDFVSEIHLLDDERRRRLGYPEGTRNRLDVKCRNDAGDAWIDLVFDGEGAPRALEVAPGAIVVVEIVSATGGYAERPLTRWVDA